MTEHYCMRYPAAKGMATSHLKDDPNVCGKPARFKSQSVFDGMDCWYCADCWDYYVQWLQYQHEKFGVPLVKP